MARSIDTQQSAVRGFVPAQNDEERFLMRHVEDLARAAFGGDGPAPQDGGARRRGAVPPVGG